MEFVPLRVRIFLLLVVFLLAVLFVVVSCVLGGSNAVNTSSNIETVSPTPKPRNIVVKAVYTSVYGVQETILTDKDGRTLYYSKEDVWRKVSCTGNCADAWIPLVFNGKGPVASATKLPGKLTTDKTVNGNQVAYNGHYLYTFFGDSSVPGNIQGQGRDDQWYVATPNLR